MNAMVLRDASRSEPGLFLAGVLAVLVHIVFVVFMFFGLDWKTHQPEGIVVDLWRDLPPPIQSTVKQSPAELKPSPPEPVEQPVQEKSLPAEITAPSPPKKPAVELKKEREELKPVAEREPVQDIQKQIEQEKQREKDKAEAEAQRLQREQALQRQREEEAMAAQREAQQAAERERVMSEIAKYKAMILAKVRSRIVMPPDLPGNPMTEYNVTLLPGGDILDVRLHKSSGYTTFDDAVERAIYLAKPLPLPPDPAFFREFRKLKITVHYQE